MENGFVYLDEAVPGVFCDAKYATDDNFTGAVVEGYRARRVVGAVALAEGLKEALERAQESGYGLLLWDGYRPQRAVDCFLRWANAREDGRTKERHYPRINRRDIVPMGYVAARSGHSRGSAIDLTLCDPRTGVPADMGGGFDLMDERSWHGAGGLDAGVTARRALLREIMEACGFQPYEREWWHYTLKNEPWPDTYFDFPIE